MWARRCLLINYNEEDDVLEMRHYCINVQPTGLSKSVKKLVVHGKIPDLGNTDDISDFILNGAYGSDSEAEGAKDSKVTLPKLKGRLEKNVWLSPAL